MRYNLNEIYTRAKRKMETEKPYKLPMRVFELRGRNNESIALRIDEVFGFPDTTSVNGGYDATCRLTVKLGSVTVSNPAYQASTGAFYRLYSQLKECHAELYGTAVYEVPYTDGAEFTLEIEYGELDVTVRGSYGELAGTRLAFEFLTDQSYISSVLLDLKKIVRAFGTNRGL